jgi:hypothetical protein
MQSSPVLKTSKDGTNIMHFKKERNTHPSGSQVGRRSIILSKSAPQCAFLASFPRPGPSTASFLRGIIASERPDRSLRRTESAGTRGARELRDCGAGAERGIISDGTASSYTYVFLSYFPFFLFFFFFFYSYLFILSFLFHVTF